MLDVPLEENDRYGFLRCVNSTQAQLENMAAIPSLNFAHNIQAHGKANNIEETVSIAAEVASFTDDGFQEDDFPPVAEADSHTEPTTNGAVIPGLGPSETAVVTEATSKLQAQPSFATPRVARTGKASQTPTWLPSGLKGKQAKEWRQARAATERKKAREEKTTQQAEEALEKAIKDAQKAKQVEEKAKKDEEEARKGRTRHKWK
jgi:hypothetical protein